MAGPGPTRPPRGPVILDLDAEPLPDAPSPAEAPPVPEPGEAPAAQALRRAARGGGLSLGDVFGAALAAFLALAGGVWAAGFVEALFARAAALGWLGAGLLGVLAAAVLLWALGEVAALARLRRVEGLRTQAETALATAGPGPARALVAGLGRLYADRPELAAPLAETAARAGEMPDGPEIVALAERRLMAGPDAAAEAAVRRAAQRVAAVTALVPMPALDMLMVLGQNAAMIRAVAEIYGGRAGWLGSWRLLRAVAQHLVATGAIAATDDLLGPLVGGGVLGRISRRFGEAAVNAALTARVGTAAIEVCRPLPFTARAAPKARTLLLGALAGWRGEPGPGGR